MSLKVSWLGSLISSCQFTRPHHFFRKSLLDVDKNMEFVEIEPWTRLRYKVYKGALSTMLQVGDTNPVMNDPSNLKYINYLKKIHIMRRYGSQ
jgi:hypothetical protein